MRKKNYRIVKDLVYGYKRLDPLPEPKQLSKFYKSKYYELIHKGGRAPEINRLMKGGKSARDERAWLCATLYSDIACVLKRLSSGSRALDIGCGTGEFIQYLKKNGFDPVGIEPSADAAIIAGSKNLEVYNLNVEDFPSRCKSKTSDTFDIVTLINVLEHVPDPANIVKIVKKILNPGGIVCIRVPNDFNALQIPAKKQLGKKEWWVAIPDHINYFSFDSLKSFLGKLGFEVVYAQSDFPMELFLLMGDDYVGNPRVGNICHQKRIQFELALPPDLRRSMYRELAKIGIGRDCLIFAQLKK